MSSNGSSSESGPHGQEEEGEETCAVVAEVMVTPQEKKKRITILSLHGSASRETISLSLPAAHCLLDQHVFLPSRCSSSQLVRSQCQLV